MGSIDTQCEYCGSHDTKQIHGELYQCQEPDCGEFFDVELQPRVEVFRRKTRWEDDDDDDE